MAVIKAFRPSFLEKEVLRNFSRLIEKEIPEALQIIVFGSRAKDGVMLQLIYILHLNIL
jgi:hypothetical protein